MLFRLFGSYRWHIVFIALVSVFSSVLAGFGASFLIPLLSILIGEDDFAGALPPFVARLISVLPFTSSLRTFLAVIVALFLLKAAALFIFGYVRGRIMFDYRARAMQELFSQVLSARWTYLLRQKAGYIQNTLVLDVDKCSHLLGSLAQAILSLVSVGIFLFFSFNISFPVTLFSLAVGGAMLLFVRPILKQMKKIGEAFSRESKEVFQYLVEHLGGIKSIKTGAVEDRVYERGAVSFRRWMNLQLRAHIFRALNKQIVEPTTILFIALVFLFTYKSSHFSFQVFVATVYLIQQIFRQIEVLYGVFQDIAESTPHAHSLLQFRDALMQETEASGGIKPFRMHNALAFENVHFGYLKEREVLSGVTFLLPKGKIVGLVGSSGAGKTSVADLILRLLEPSLGKILLDEINYKDISSLDLRRHIGYVSQDIFLLHDTIEENIRFYREDIGMEAIVNAARKANIYEFIHTLPQGFDTRVGDRGVMLSGGQRQRIVLARILAGSPDVLILDEATSALDNESEALIHASIGNLRGSTTVFIIAHRLSTVRDVDHLLVLDQGKIIEEGRPEELLQNSQSHFYRMYYHEAK